MPTVKEVITFLESVIPPSYQESWDNSGLHAGDTDQEVSGVLLTVDLTDEVLDEAIASGCNLVISHHPILFDRYIKRLTGSNNYEKLLIKAIKNDLVLYSMHTNLDFFDRGINYRLCQILGLKNCVILKPLQGWLKKLVTFVPEDYAGKVRADLFAAGAGHIGNYDFCSYNLTGQGTFRALDGANPFVGDIGKIHFEPEVRIETIFPKHLTGKIISALLQAHPYEEVAYDIYPLDNEYQRAGIGMIGEIEPIEEKAFLSLVQDALNAQVLQYSQLTGRQVKKVAICSGSCGFILGDAIAHGADALLTGETSYHTFLDARGKLLLITAGHFETEKFAIDVFYDLIKEKFDNFAVRKAENAQNLINYHI